MKYGTATENRTRLERAANDLHTALVEVAGEVAADVGDHVGPLDRLRHLAVALEATEAAVRTSEV